MVIVASTSDFAGDLLRVPQTHNVGDDVVSGAGLRIRFGMSQCGLWNQTVSAILVIPGVLAIWLNVAAGSGGALSCLHGMTARAMPLRVSKSAPRVPWVLCVSE